MKVISRIVLLISATLILIQGSGCSFFSNPSTRGTSSSDQPSAGTTPTTGGDDQPSSSEQNPVSTIITFNSGQAKKVSSSQYLGFVMTTPDRVQGRIQNDTDIMSDSLLELHIDAIDALFSNQ